MTDQELIHEFGRELFVDLIDRVPIVNGTTRSQIHIEFTERGFEIYVPEHFQALITGRGPSKNDGSGIGQTLQQKLLSWIEAKGIIPKPKANGMPMSQISLSWAMATIIHKSGTRLFRFQNRATFLDGWFDDQKKLSMMDRIAQGVKVKVKTDIKEFL